MTHSGIKDLSFLLLLNPFLLLSQLPIHLILHSSLRLSPSSVCPQLTHCIHFSTSVHLSNPPFLALFLTPLPPVLSPCFPPLSFQPRQFLPLCVCRLLILAITPSAPLRHSLPSISSLSFAPLIHIHPLFYTLHDICLFIHLSMSLCPFPHLCLIRPRLTPHLFFVSF